MDQKSNKPKMDTREGEKNGTKVEPLTARNQRLPSSAPRPSIATPNEEPYDDEKYELRKLLQEKIEDIKSTRHREADITDLDICRLTEGHNSQSGAADQDTLLELEPKLSLPDSNGEQDTSAVSIAATYNSVADADRSVESILSASEAKSKLDDPNWLCDAAAGIEDDMDTYNETEEASECTSEEVLPRSGAKNSIKLSETTLQNYSKPSINRKYSEIAMGSPQPERAKDSHAPAPEQVFSPTTESKEYIKQDSEFIIPGPTPMRIPHDELFNSFKGFSNMYLAHEISLSADFRVERYIPPPESIESRIKVQLKRAYWDLFNEEIHKHPPVFRRALEVFKEVKQSILGLLLPHNTKTRDMINRELDVELISQRIEHDAFNYDDFKTYSEFIIQTLAQLCSPSRDGDIEELKKLDDPALIFEGILELAEKMKLDIANFYIQQFRPNIIRHCAHYERIKFADFLIMERRLGEDGLRATRNWLARHSITRNDLSTIMAKAFSELLGVNYDEDPPETIALDIGRFRQTAQKFLRLAIVGAISVTGSGHIHAILGDTPFEFRDMLTEHMMIILTDEDVQDISKLKERTEAAAEETLVLTNQFLKQRIGRELNATETDGLRQCVREIESPDNKVRALIYRRILEYAEEIFISQYQFHATVPPGLYTIRTQVVSLVRELSQVVLHNRMVYGTLYTAMIEKQVGPFTIFDESTEDPEFEKVMQILHENDAPPPNTESNESVNAPSSPY